MSKHTYLNGMSSAEIEEKYYSFISNPDSITDDKLKYFFEGFELARTEYKKNKNKSEQENSKKLELSQSDNSKIQKEFNVISLIKEYRSRGHLFTKTNPVRERRAYFPKLDIENYGLSKDDLNNRFASSSEIGINNSTLSEIIEKLNATYCKSIGIEFMHMRNIEAKDWVMHKIESEQSSRNFTKEEKKLIYKKINQAILFENFIHKKFVGQKRFSLEGAENVIPAIESLLLVGSSLGAKEFVFGMAHRGRLNVLANIFGKTYEDIFNEFYGRDYENPYFSGDVKYHLGYSSVRKLDNNKEVKLHLSPNPSHLEAVGPVVQGISRAIIYENYKGENTNLIPVAIHGDAAIAGLGVVYEAQQMSETKAYTTGGTIHIVINNQVGFTTSFLQGRSSIYCTDIAKITENPVLHVNGDDAEAVVYAMELAVEFRQKFKKDIFIDLLCYRKYGHNEGDEPMFTQPALYSLISKHKNPKQIYKEKLLNENIVTQKDLEKIDKDFNDILNDRLEEAKERILAEVTPLLQSDWKNVKKMTYADRFIDIKTSVSKKDILEISDKLTFMPDNLNFFRKSLKLQQTRKKSVENNKLDWAMAELLAYGSLLKEETPIRFTGEDVERGTFAHRHANFTISDSDHKKYTPLNNLVKNQKATIYISNSTLSEYAVMGYEYGYAMTKPHTLTIWEAQFGDFVNGAQTIIDQFLVSAEQKWNQMNSLMIYLPHGYEGQGAEHSNARMERFLEMCSGINIKVANCTTPANFFHLIRAQIKSPFRKPCVVFTPKSLLRNPKCISKIEDLQKEFKFIIDDEYISEKNKVKKIILCSGKFYYDLHKHRTENNIKNIAIIRIEQLYPLNVEMIKDIIKKYPKDVEICWAQEEPLNYGALHFIDDNLHHRNGITIKKYSRKKSATSATGSPTRHSIEHKELINKVFS